MNVSSHGYDLSTVPLLGAYPAFQCPVRTQFKFLPPEGVEPAPVGPVQQASFDAGNEFEAMVFDEICDLHPHAERIPKEEAGFMIAATVEAMQRNVPLILGGWLPADELGRRTGKPDVLLFDDGGYIPMDVKVYTLLRRDEAATTSASVSALEHPSFDDASLVPGTWSSSNRKKAALQLAHYWRMLEACQHASNRGALGGVIDSSREVVWVDLSAPDGRIQNQRTYEEEPVTWLRAYDHEFEFRRDVAAHTIQRRDDMNLDPKVQPVWIGECTSCEWNAHCRSELEELDHLSLLSHMDYWQFRTLRLAGIETRRQLAERDYFTALLADKLSATQLRAVFDNENAEEGLADLWSRSKTIQPFVQKLAGDGIVTAADLRERMCDQLIVDLGGALKAAWIDQARAALLGSPLVGRGVGDLDLPVYDVEIDFDMENDLDRHVYMWGFIVTRDGQPDPYQVFDRYEQVDESAVKHEAELFLRFWQKVNQELQDALGSQKSFQMFCWSSAERTQAKRIVEAAVIGGLPSLDDVEQLFDAYCTDLERVFKRHFVSADGTSIKKIAPLAGHTWDLVHDHDDDAESAAGDVSMLKHRIAVESRLANERDRAISWLRTYNEADVEATREVRAWMIGAIKVLPRADDLDSSFSLETG